MTSTAWDSLPAATRSRIRAAARLGQPADTPALIRISADWAVGRARSRPLRSLVWLFYYAAALLVLAAVTAGFGELGAATFSLLALASLIGLPLWLTRWRHEFIGAANLTALLPSAVGVSGLTVGPPPRRRGPLWVAAGVTVTACLAFALAEQLYRQAGRSAAADAIGLTPWYLLGAGTLLVLVMYGMTALLRARGLPSTAVTFTLDDAGLVVPQLGLRLSWDKITTVEFAPLGPPARPLSVRFGLRDPQAAMATSTLAPSLRQGARQVLRDHSLNFPLSIIDADPLVVVATARRCMHGSHTSA
jgi:hypothetical protein